MKIGGEKKARDSESELERVGTCVCLKLDYFEQREKLERVALYRFFTPVTALANGRVIPVRKLITNGRSNKIDTFPIGDKLCASSEVLGKWLLTRYLDPNAFLHWKLRA